MQHKINYEEAKPNVCNWHIGQAESTQLEKDVIFPESVCSVRPLGQIADLHSHRRRSEQIRGQGMMAAPNTNNS